MREGEAQAMAGPLKERGEEIVRTEDKVIRIVGDWAVHTFLDKDGAELHSIGFPKAPLFSEEDIAASDQEALPV
jgi:hypothetical protein